MIECNPHEFKFQPLILTISKLHHDTLALMLILMEFGVMDNLHLD